MTLLERYDNEDWLNIKSAEIRRALAIAQAVEEWGSELSKSRGETLTAKELLLDRADQLLKGEK